MNLNTLSHSSDRIRHLDNLSADDLKDLLPNRPISAFVGSGISIWHPTNLPQGQSISNDIFRALFGEDDDPQMRCIRPWFEEFPFERIMERCPEPITLHRLITSLYNVARNNPIHNRLAEALLTGSIDSIVTTNYDCGLDKALAELSGKNDWADLENITRVVRNTPVSHASNPVYFKIHGSADDPETIVLTLRQESALKEWKVEQLRSLWSDRNLIIIGYSGTDFEICPEIPRLAPAGILWNFLSESDITQNARRVIAEANGIIVIGDMRELLTSLMSPVDATLREPVKIDELINKHFNRFDRALWSVRILNSMTCSAAAIHASEQLLELCEDDRQRFSALREYGRALCYGGAHKRSAKMLDIAAGLASKLGESDFDLCDLYFASCDSWRSFGHFRRAHKRLLSAQSLAENSGNMKLRATVGLKQLALRRQVYNFAKRLRAKRLALKARSYAESIISPLAKPLMEEGEWIEYYELRLWSDRFDLPASITSPRDRYEAPLPREGYSHLGNVMMQLIAFRDQLKKASWIEEELIVEAENAAKHAEILGIYAEAWKMRFLIARKLLRQMTTDMGRIKKNFLLFQRNFRRCEYWAPLRPVILLIDL